MSFENPSNQQAPDDYEEIGQLSPKLTALADQLSDDARMLSERFPPLVAIASTELPVATDRCSMSGFGDSSQSQQHAVQSAVLRRSAGNLRFLVPAASAAALVCAVWLWRTTAAYRNSQSSAPAPTTLVMAEADLETQPRTKQYSHRTFADGPESSAELLRGLSSAEQEALLDLLEGDHGQKESVSI